ncbi:MULTISPECIES: hypothetical protein [Capnocytophaga]|uniref:hypothetical protein n=1 Tax=Capnocytophaga TaxID=1016 RepID=UPI00020C704C|nr:MULTISPECIES: hypothetical protein [unclassified Capnocytophaga]KHE67972.1 hypothetical protein HMPREF9074_09411 [Capnocytophaga sp. oral taxon 329 str. F0087]QGS18028.1 hypothetical protein FOC45_07020 [Capnocytophaga sp. FDAARGOS_737]
MFYNLFLGIISGIVTAFLLWFFKSLWGEKLIPFLKKISYSGYIVAGTWYEDDGIDKSTIYLKQVGQEIKGTIIITKPLLGETKNFFCKGIIRGSVISIMTFNSDRTQIGAQSYILFVKTDGKVLNGSKIYYNIFPSDYEDEIQHIKIAWWRENKKTND